MSRRLLIVDDEANIRRMMRLTLETDGYDVDEAEDGGTALERFGDGSRFDAVLLDQRMPPPDGIEVLRQIKTRTTRVPIIMVTAFGSVELAVEAMKLGATDFLRKPITPELLRGAVAAALSKIPSRSNEPPAASPAPPEELPPVEVWTVNGFFVRPFSASSGLPANEHQFEVRHVQRGVQGQVTVSIEPTEVQRIARMAQKDLRPEGTFWHQRAERALVDHLFRHAAMPPDNRLVVERISDTAAHQAKRWTSD